MDRDETIRISRLAAFGGLTNNDVTMILMQYCIEHDKSYYKSNMFVYNLLKNSSLLSHCLGIALGFYERKFTVYKLWSAPNPLNIQGQERTLLQIF